MSPFLSFGAGFVVGACCAVGGIVLWVVRAYRWLASGQ